MLRLPWDDGSDSQCRLVERHRLLMLVSDAAAGVQQQVRPRARRRSDAHLHPAPCLCVLLNATHEH